MSIETKRMSKRLPVSLTTTSSFPRPSLTVFPSFLPTHFLYPFCPLSPSTLLYFFLHSIGKVMSFKDTRRLLNGGDAFLLMLQQFCLDDVTDARLLLAETYVDNPMFRPVNVEVR